MNVVAALRENGVFAQAEPSRVAQLVAQSEVVEAASGSRPVREGDASTHVFVLLSGVVGVYYSSSDGDTVLVKIFGAPAVFGEMEAFFGQPRQEFVECFEPCRLVRVPSQAFLDFVHADKDACFALLRDVSARLAIAAYHERALAFLDAPTRLAGLFLDFLEAYGQFQNGRWKLKRRIPYETLARCLAVNVRSIDRAMTAWQKEGIVTREDGYFSFASKDALLQRADPDRVALFSRINPAAGR